MEFSSRNCRPQIFIKRTSQYTAVYELVATAKAGTINDTAMASYESFKQQQLKKKTCCEA